MYEISISRLRKSFGSNVVLHGLDLHIAEGEFVGLMGPNGAGKSTLMKLLGGIERPDSGEIRFRGKPVRSLGQLAEVGFLHQELGLIDEMSITDNLRLGQAAMRIAGPVLDRRAEHDAAERVLSRVGLTGRADRLVGSLSPGEKALVAVARLLERGARVLFIDEATSTLPPADARRFIAALEQMAADGATVVMVSHKLSEILDATHRVVVLLDGDVAADVRSCELDREALVELLFAHEVPARPEERSRDAAPGRELVRLEQAFGGRAGPVDLVIRSGEVLGLTGLPGSGLHDVALLAHGSMRPTAGSVSRVNGTRIALVPPHRETQGGFGVLSVRSNMTLSSLDRWRHATRVLLQGRERGAAREMIHRLSVRPADPEARYAGLSGGNKQKAIFGRVLFEAPDVYVLCEPTRGVDVATRGEIYALMRELAGQDVAVLVVTSDFEDLFAVCDRIGLVRDGRVQDLHEVHELTPEQLEVFM
jgi:ribose transport system ATP-binding protein